MMAIKALEKITHSYNYESYKRLVFSLAENNGSTGTVTEERIAATKINAQRIKRIDKQSQVGSALIVALKNFKKDCLWIVITESWCGDGAQCIPIIAKMVEHCPYIELQLILRDENLEIMDAHLANGCRSIPKLICLNKNNYEEMGTWGSRPDKIQKLAMEFKQNNPNATHDEFVTNLHLLYARDKTNAIQEEFIALLNKWQNVE